MKLFINNIKTDVIKLAVSQTTYAEDGKDDKYEICCTLNENLKLIIRPDSYPKNMVDAPKQVFVFTMKQGLTVKRNPKTIIEAYVIFVDDKKVSAIAEFLPLERSEFERLITEVGPYKRDDGTIGRPLTIKDFQKINRLHPHLKDIEKQFEAVDIKEEMQIKTKIIPVNGKHEVAYDIFRTGKTVTSDVSFVLKGEKTREQEVVRIIFRGWAYERPLFLREGTVLTLDNVVCIDDPSPSVKNAQKVKMIEHFTDILEWSKPSLYVGLEDYEIKLKFPECESGMIQGGSTVSSPVKELTIEEERFVKELEASERNEAEIAKKPEADMLTICESAKYAGVNERTIRNWLVKTNADGSPLLAGVIGKGRLTRIPRKSLEPFRKRIKATSNKPCKRFQESRHRGSGSPNDLPGR